MCVALHFYDMTFVCEKTDRAVTLRGDVASTSIRRHFGTKYPLESTSKICAVISRNLKVHSELNRDGTERNIKQGLLLSYQVFRSAKCHHDKWSL